MPQDRRNKEAIRSFLSKVREAIDKGRVIVARRKEFIDTIAYFDFKMRDVEFILSNLTLADYVEGPMENLNRPEFPWLYVFLYPYKGHRIYIKISVGDHLDGKGDSLFVLSFHIEREELYRQ